MSFYEYRAVDSEGRPMCGARRGETPDAVRQELAAEGLRASSIRRRDDPGAGGLLRRGVSAEDLAFLHRQTANLLAAGLPLPRALRAVARESGKHELKLLVDAVASDVEKGRTLSEALGAHGRAVPPFVADLVKAGEAAGNLPAVLQQVAEGGETDARMRRSVRSALAYPLIVAILALAVMILNGSGVLLSLFSVDAANVLDSPSLEEVWRGRRSGSSEVRWVLEFVTSPLLWGGILGGFVALGLFGTSFFSLRGRRRRVPVFGRIVERVLLARFCRVLGLLTGRGVPLPASLRLAGAASDSEDLYGQAAAAAEAVESGEPLGEAVESIRALPVTARWAVSAAAARGDLAGELLALARHAEEGALDCARRFGMVLETSLILLVGLFVLIGGGGSVVRAMSDALGLLQLLWLF